MIASIFYFFQSPGSISSMGREEWVSSRIGKICSNFCLDFGRDWIRGRVRVDGSKIGASVVECFFSAARKNARERTNRGEGIGCATLGTTPN